MLRKLTPIAGAVLLLAGSASANSLGLVRSNASYSVNRAATVLNGSADRPLLLNSGDEIRSGAGLLKIEGLDGQTVLLDENSSLKVREDAVNLQKGRVAVAMPPTTASRVEVYDLAVTPVDDPTSTAQHGNLGVGTISENEIEVYSQGRMFKINSVPDGSQIAVLGAGDGMRLVKDAMGTWKPIVPLMQDEAGEKDAAADPEETKRRRGGFWIFPSTAVGVAVIGGGAVAAGVVGYTVYDNNKDDSSNNNDDNNDNNEEPSRSHEDTSDDDDDDDREPSSPSKPTPTVRPTPTQATPTETPSPTPSQTPIETQFL
jgi:hypothetical protein